MALILVVDDNDDVLMLLDAVLGSHERILAHDSTSGMNLAEQHQPDLILLDVGMPDVDGLEVCRMLRGAPSTAATPILLVTARWDIVQQPKLWQGVGATDALLKPFSPSALLAKITELLDRRTTA